MSLTPKPPKLALLLCQYRSDQQLLWNQLGKTLEDKDFVLARPDGKLPNTNAATRAFAKTIRKAGLPHIRLHDLQHTHATLMRKADEG